MNALAIILTIVVSTAFGVTLLLSYMVARMLRADRWDKSNMTNALRLIAHMTMHPEDFVHMYYTVRSAKAFNTPGGSRIVSRLAFPYLGKDELSEVVKTRPNLQERTI